jgi:hypothetical protein
LKFYKLLRKGLEEPSQGHLLNSSFNKDCWGDGGTSFHFLKEESQPPRYLRNPHINYGVAYNQTFQSVIFNCLWPYFLKFCLLLPTCPTTRIAHGKQHIAGRKRPESFPRSTTLHAALANYLDISEFYFPHLQSGSSIPSVPRLIWGLTKIYAISVCQCWT